MPVDTDLIRDNMPGTNQELILRPASMSSAQIADDFYNNGRFLQTALCLFFQEMASVYLQQMALAYVYTQPSLVAFLMLTCF